MKAQTSLYVVVDHNAGAIIPDVVLSMIQLSGQLQTGVQTEFNGVSVQVRPDSVLEDVVAGYYATLDRKLKATHNASGYEIARQIFGVAEDK